MSNIAFKSKTKVKVIADDNGIKSVTIKPRKAFRVATTAIGFVTMVIGIGIIGVGSVRSLEITEGGNN